MSETILDYDKQNQNLPQSLREFLGTADRVIHQNYCQFLPFYEGMEMSAVFNNRYAAEFAGGFTVLNYKYFRSGAAPRLLSIFTSKAVGLVWYQADNEQEAVFNAKFDSKYFSKVLNKTVKQAAATGRAIMVNYINDDEEIEVATYNLFRHKIRFDRKGDVKEMWAYIVRIDRKDYSNVICEHRFYKKTQEGLKPYQEFLVYSFSDTKIDKAPKVVDEGNIPNDIKEKYKDIKFGVARELKFPTLGVYDINYTLDNSKIPDSDIPEAMFVDALDTGVCLDSSITGKEVEKEIGRGRILIPDFDQQSTGFIDQVAAGGRVLRTINPNISNPILTPYPSRSMEDSKPQNVQFDIRSDQWIAQIDNDTARLCENVGIGIIDYCPRLLGGNQRTDDEINAMTDITANTVKDFRNINEDKINKMLTDIANYYKLNTTVSIRWSMASILNPSKNTDLVIRQLQAGLISQKEAIQRANPDLRPQEVEDLYKTIQAERGAEAVENSFNNF